MCCLFLLAQFLLLGEANYITAAYFLMAEGKVEVIRRMRGAQAAMRYIQRATPSTPMSLTEASQTCGSAAVAAYTAASSKAGALQPPGAGAHDGKVPAVLKHLCQQAIPAG